MDETTLSLHPVLRKCWMKRGQQKRIPAAGQQRLQHLFGAYNWRTNEVVWLATEHKNTDAFIRFLEHFMRTVQTGKPLVLVLDNASYHHSAPAEATLACFEADGLITCWLPPYCSDCNPIERFWAFLKGVACANKLFASLPALLTSVSACLRNQNDFACPNRFLFLNTSLA